jgi:hypothetical protein
MATSLDDMVQQGLDGGCVMIDARQVVAPSGIDRMRGKVNALFLSEEGGGDDFLSVCNGVRLGFARSVCSPNLL